MVLHPKLPALGILLIFKSSLVPVEGTLVLLFQPSLGYKIKVKGREEDP